MHRTRVGYCGGETPDPTYRKVCASGNKDSLHPGEAAATPNGYAQYAETIQLEFDEAQLSYADVLDSAKGWAGGIRFNPSVKKQFEDFYNRSDTFSLGVCNGCQLSALLGCEEPVEPVVANVLLR